MFATVLDDNFTTSCYSQNDGIKLTCITFLAFGHVNVFEQKSSNSRRKIMKRDRRLGVWKKLHVFKGYLRQCWRYRKPIFHATLFSTEAHQAMLEVHFAQIWKWNANLHEFFFIDQVVPTVFTILVIALVIGWNYMLVILVFLAFLNIVLKYSVFSPKNLACTKTCGSWIKPITVLNRRSV